MRQGYNLSVHYHLEVMIQVLIVITIPVTFVGGKFKFLVVFHMLKIKVYTVSFRFPSSQYAFTFTIHVTWRIILFGDE